jgi:hypothetical protein
LAEEKRLGLKEKPETSQDIMKASILARKISGIYPTSEKLGLKRHADELAIGYDIGRRTGDWTMFNNRVADIPKSKMKSKDFEGLLSMFHKKLGM